MIGFKRLVGSTTFTGSISPSKASAAAVTTGRSAAAVVRRPGGQWSVLLGLGKATNQELGGCRQGAGKLQVVPVCVGEGCRQQVRFLENPPHAPAQDGGVARNCQPAGSPLRPHRQDGGGLQARPWPCALPPARASHPGSCRLTGQRAPAFLAQVQHKQITSMSFKISLLHGVSSKKYFQYSIHAFSERYSVVPIPDQYWNLWTF